ncbi:unnamed protein product [Effrenium voratum]|nr:unnamed protein product [Effrenium voratum]
MLGPLQSQWRVSAVTKADRPHKVAYGTQQYAGGGAWGRSIPALLSVLSARCMQPQPRSRRAAESDEKHAKPAQEGFKFDERLWKQFLRIAQPYFLPIAEDDEQEEGPGFLALIGATLLGVVGGTFLLALAAGSAARALLPLPEGLTATLSSMSQAPFFVAAAVALVVAGATFFPSRQRLEGRWQQWGLLALLLFLLFCVTGLNVLLSYVFRAIDNVLVAKDEAGFMEQLGVFAAALVVAVPVISGYRYVRLNLGRYWRQDLTELFLDKYLSDRAFYLLDSNSQSTNVDNPDQRISEDANYFTKVTLDFLLDVLDSILNLISFSAILWSTSQSLTGALAIYAIVGTYIAIALGGRLVGLNYKQLRLQADFRYSLVHIRDNAEAIAFYGGERREQREVTGKLDAALQNYDQLIIWETGLSAYQKAFFYLARLVPYSVLGGLYFSGQVDFGTLGQAQFAFSMVLGSVTIIVSRIQEISRFSAGISRLGAFWEALLPDEATASKRIQTEEGSGLQLNMTLYTPDGARLLVEELDVALQQAGPNRRLLVVGSSGVGKSSVLRAVAGLWTRGEGHIKRPAASEMLFLPQRPYMPLGDLRTQLLYPSEGTLGHMPDQDLLEILARFGLADLPDRFEGGFEAVQDWSRVLSLGEQQRLAAARCFTTRPRLVVLDEATSALPLPAERIVYQQLAADPHIEGYVSVGHRVSLGQYHDVVLELLGGGGWRLLTPQEYEATAAAR